MFATGSRALFVGLILSAAAAGQDRPLTLESVPPLERSAPHFYHAVAAPGRAVQVEWTATPTTVPLNRELILTFTVRNAANPHELKRPDLGQFEAITRHFQVLDRGDPSAKPGAAEVQSIYTLRPREIGRFELPRLEYRYFRPDLPAGRQFRTTYTQPFTITVEPPAATTDTNPPVPLDGPEEFFALAEPSRYPSPGRLAWLAPVAAIPFVVAGWVLMWRWLFPDAARLAKIRRHRAVRTALDQLRREQASPDLAATAATAFRGYLTARFGVPPMAQTPAEVAAALVELDQPLDRAADAERFLRACDEARFGSVHDGGASLAIAAEGLIRAWEGADG